MLRRWLDRLRTKQVRVVDADTLADFILGRAAFIAQKAVMDHLNAVIGVSTLAEHAGDPDVADALHRCRWQSFAAALGDSTEVAHIHLRHAGYEAGPLVTKLRTIVEHGLSRTSALDRGLDWTEELDAIERRLARCALAAPHVVHTLGGPTTERIIAALPTAPQLEEGFREVILNSVRFNLCRAYDDLEAQADVAALGRSLGLRRAGP